MRTRGGVEDTRLRAKGTKNFEAKNRPFRGQGHRRKCSKKKKVFKIFFQAISKKSLQNFFSGKKGLQKFFFKQSLLEKTKKKIFADFPQGFWRFPTKFQRFKNSAVLKPRTGQFSRT